MANTRAQEHIPEPSANGPLLAMALGLAMASAVSLGLARFSYALLLPAMRDDLGWTYAVAGGMNTANAAGYLLGAWLLPRWQARFDGQRIVVAGGVAAALALVGHAAVESESALLFLRLLCGIASAASFAGGGLVAATLAQQAAGQARAGLILGIYYGGTGLGIVACSWVIPAVLQGPPRAWQTAWLALAGLAVVCTAVLAWTTRGLRCPPVPAATRESAPWGAFVWALSGYACFGLGYIGYMTFVVSLLREQGLSAQTVAQFYAVLGFGVMASSWLWAGLLQRHRGGRPMAVLNALLALATLLPVAFSHPLAVFASGALFGAVFLSVVASTTALVRHNCRKAAWPSGIAAFTITFAAGQMVGPVLVGWVADATGGGLALGFALSAVLLALGSGLASVQRPLPQPEEAAPPATCRLGRIAGVSAKAR